MTKNTKPTEAEKPSADEAAKLEAEKAAAEAAEAEKLAEAEAAKAAELVDVVLSKDAPVAALVFPGLGRATRDRSVRIPAGEFDRLRVLYGLEKVPAKGKKG